MNYEEGDIVMLRVTENDDDWVEGTIMEIRFDEWTVYGIDTVDFFLRMPDPDMGRMRKIDVDVMRLI